MPCQRRGKCDLRMQRQGRAASVLARAMAVDSVKNLDEDMRAFPLLLRMLMLCSLYDVTMTGASGLRI